MGGEEAGAQMRRAVAELTAAEGKQGQLAASEQLAGRLGHVQTFKEEARGDTNKAMEPHETLNLIADAREENNNSMSTQH